MCFFAATAAAEEPDDDDEPCPPPAKRHSYGWQTLATDGAGIGLVIVGSAIHSNTSTSGAAYGAGAASLFLGAPIVHVAHGRWQVGVLDFGLRLTMPIVGGYIASTCTSGECGSAAVAALMVGIAPIWLDPAFLAWEDVPVESARHERTTRPERMLARLGVSELHPTTKVTRRGFELGLGGAF